MYVESDEQGFWLIVPTPHFDELEMMRIRIEDPERLYDSVKGQIGPYLRERDEALRSLPVPGIDVHGYDISDPQHENFHSVHADLYDQRDGK